ncbi:GTP 3',8-cyclase MoaA [Paludisphaera rhizosphaerae]|uniref:GTP 3',8-cyclase MoaA n=1 Tax=Paludisphaera rhizosphaerae TaxID=2711216 RepID=UPI0013EB9074|nr:GTP 3',8-cyclase MoaA [Paludisphaera rhizosphaerae]
MSLKPRLIDSFGRVHNNLRVSVTDRCNLRCVYCMPEQVEFMPRERLLSFEEIARFVAVVAPLGVDKIRLTGGEPLLRKDLDVLVRMLVAIEGVSDVGMTTNGMLLAPIAGRLREAGLERLNISLDTLDSVRFERLARRRGLDDAIAGVHAAKREGFDPIKLNAVVIRGFNEDDVAPLARFARELGVEMRFIEYMPLDAGHLWEREKVFYAQEILDVIAREVAPLAPAADQDPRAPALAYDYLDGGGRVGLISSVSRPFCGSCNRLRLTSDGKLRNCLFALEETDVREMLRSEAPEEAVAQAVAASVAAKWEGHEINTARFIQPDRPMYSIGG